MGRVGDRILNDTREMFKAAALDEEGKPRVDAEQIREAIANALAKDDLAIRVFSSGSVGVQVRLNLTVANDQDEEFDLKGQVLVTIPETVAKK